MEARFANSSWQNSYSKWCSTVTKIASSMEISVLVGDNVSLQLTMVLELCVDK